MSAHQQQRAPEPAHTPDVAAGGQGFALDHGNAANQEAMGIDPGDAQQRMLDYVDALWSARLDGVDEVWSRCGPGPSDWLTDLLASAITASIIATTGQVTAPIVAGIVALPALGAAGRAILGKFVDTFATAHTSSVSSFVKGAVADNRQGGKGVVDTYFLSTKGALRVEAVEAVQGYRKLARDLAEAGVDPSTLDALSTQLAAATQKAEERQMQASVVGWMDFLANLDTDGDTRNGSDLTRAGTGSGLFHPNPRGIVHLMVTFGDPADDVAVRRCKVTGLSPELLPYLTAGNQPLSEMGLPVFIGGPVSTGPLSTIEIGRNEQGVMSETINGGDQWLASYATFHGISPEQATRHIMMQCSGVPLSKLPVELG